MCKQNGELFLCPLFPGDIHSPWFSTQVSSRQKKKKVCFASSKFHELRNFFYAYITIHKRPLQWIGNSGCYSKNRQAGQLLCEDIIRGIVTNTNCSHLSSCAIFCHFPFSFIYFFIMLFMVQTYSNCTMKETFQQIIKYLTTADKQ